MEILSNIGAVDLNGLPRLSLSLASIPELSRLEFSFRLIHGVRVDRNMNARSEWVVSGLRTCVYFEPDGSLVWLKPSAQKLRLSRKGSAYEAADGSSAKVLDGDCLELVNRDGSVWRYEKNFLKSITDARYGHFQVSTDRETIFEISMLVDGKPRQLLHVEYSDHGLLRRLEFENGRGCDFLWDGGRLNGVETMSGGRTQFEYDGALLARWYESDGSGGYYKWARRLNAERGVAFGRAPVVIREDGRFRYEYANAGNINIIRVYTVDGFFISETSIGAGGMTQKTPGGVQRVPAR